MNHLGFEITAPLLWLAGSVIVSIAFVVASVALSRRK